MVRRLLHPRQYCHTITLAGLRIPSLSSVQQTPGTLQSLAASLSSRNCHTSLATSHLSIAGLSIRRSTFLTRQSLFLAGIWDQRTARTGPLSSEDQSLVLVCSRSLPDAGLDWALLAGIVFGRFDELCRSLGLRDERGG